VGVEPLKHTHLVRFGKFEQVAQSTPDTLGNGLFNVDRVSDRNSNSSFGGLRLNGVITNWHTISSSVQFIYASRPSTGYFIRNTGTGSDGRSCHLRHCPHKFMQNNKIPMKHHSEKNKCKYHWRRCTKLTTSHIGQIIKYTLSPIKLIQSSMRRKINCFWPLFYCNSTTFAS